MCELFFCRFLSLSIFSFQNFWYFPLIPKKPQTPKMNERKGIYYLSKQIFPYSKHSYLVEYGISVQWMWFSSRHIHSSQLTNVRCCFQCVWQNTFFFVCVAVSVVDVHTRSAALCSVYELEHWLRLCSHSFVDHHYSVSHRNIHLAAADKVFFVFYLFILFKFSAVIVSPLVNFGEHFVFLATIWFL